MALPSFVIILLPGPNSKSISVLGKSKSESCFVLQYWTSLKTSLTTLASLSPDLGNTWKLIPGLNQFFEIFRIKISNFDKFCNVPPCHVFQDYVQQLSARLVRIDTQQYCRIDMIPTYFGHFFGHF